ncbi:MAG: LysM peptidoglycan-binding domain-containing protein, partial [Chitinophagaceae bacterium]|nr:LysM peptidoglycan-binding domain-containing protein [Chitinophagaceae bacterium]
QDQKTVILNYISTYKEIAIAEMQRTGVPASIKLAQGIHETMAGTSVLVTKSNNHFGIKCKTSWGGPSVSHDDDARGECFRKYESSSDSYRDHSNFLKGSARYATLFQLDPTDYSAWAYGLKKAGYATNPRYPQVIIKLIEDYNLQDYTMIALGKMPPKDEMLAGTEKGSTRAIPAVVVVEDEPVVTLAMVQDLPEAREYPSGDFKINDTRVVHVKAGTSFLSIANQYGISLSRIFDFNDLRESEISEQDQLIFLQRKRKTGAHEYHTVKRGETVHGIAQDEGIRLEALLEYNHLQPGMNPAVGELLYMKDKAPGRPALAMEVKAQSQNLGYAKKELSRTMASGPYAGFTTYTVQAKETIYSIAKKNQVSIDDLVSWNQLSDYTLKTGQQLKIYKN